MRLITREGTHMHALARTQRQWFVKEARENNLCALTLFQNQSNHVHFGHDGATAAPLERSSDVTALELTWAKQRPMKARKKRVTEAKGQCSMRHGRCLFLQRRGLHAFRQRKCGVGVNSV